MDLTQFWGPAGGAFVIAAVYALNRGFVLSRQAKVIAAAVFSIVVEALIGYLLGKDVATIALMSFVVWLVSMGVWSGGKASLNK